MTKVYSGTQIARGKMSVFEDVSEKIPTRSYDPQKSQDLPPGMIKMLENQFEEASALIFITTTFHYWSFESTEQESL